MRRLPTTTAIILVGALAGLLLLPVQAHASEDELTGDPEKEAEFVERINALRADHGLAGLKTHPELVDKARDWSRTMAEAGDIWHSELSDGVTVDWRRLGENVGRGGSVEALHQAFVDSPGHFENLVDAGFQHVGLGVTVNGDGTIYVSEVFMERAPQPSSGASSPAAGTPDPPESDDDPGPSNGSDDSHGDHTHPAPAPPRDEPDASEPSPRLTSVLDRLRALDH